MAWVKINSVTESTRSEIFAAIAAQAASYPDRIAVSVGTDALTYIELLNELQSVGVQLRDALRKSSGVLILMTENAIDHIICMVATLEAGHYYLPLDPETPIPRVIELIEHTGAAALFAAPETIGRLLSVLNIGRRCSVGRNRKGFSSELAFLQNQSGSRLSSGLTGSGCVICTSGSTATPKVVAIAESSIINHVNAFQKMLGTGSDDRIPVISSISFSLSITPIFLGLTNGSELAFPQVSRRPDARLLASMAADPRSTALKTVPSLLKRFYRLAHRGDMSFAHLRAIILSGEPVDMDLVHSWRKLYPKTRIIISYGCTEAFAATAYEVPAEIAAMTGPFVPLGRAQPNIRTFVMVDGGRVAVPGALGEICVNGANLCLGYLERGQLRPPVLATIHDNEQTCSVYKTGDLGIMWPDGILSFVGRADQTIKINGNRLSPEEVENALNQAPGVVASAVRKERIDGRERLSCFLEAGESGVDIRAIRSFAASRLPGYMLPHMYHCVQSIPRLPSGKIDRLRVVRLTGERLLSTSVNQTTQEFVAQTILEIWREILRLEEIGLEDKFDELGGDSLGFLDMLLEVERKLHVHIPTSLVLSEMTVRSLTNEIRALSEDLLPTVLNASTLRVINSPRFTNPCQWRWNDQCRVVSCRRKAAYNLTYSQQTSLNRPDGGRTYFTFVRIILRNHLREDALFSALIHLIRRHEMLLTVLDEASLTQCPLEVSADLVVPSFDLTGAGLVELNEIISQIYAEPFELSHWPLFRAAIFHLNNHTEFVLQLSHMVVDLFGVHTLTEELIALYEYYVDQNRPLRLTPAMNNQTYVSELESLRYSDDVVQRECTQIRDYLLCVQNTKVLPRFEQLRNPGSGTEQVLPIILDKQPDTYLLLACYAWTLADWIDIEKVPIRVGTPARGYREFRHNYLRLVTKGNDHLSIVLDRQSAESVEAWSDQIRQIMDRYRTDSINCDKIICLNGKSIEPAGIFSFGPLGSFTTAASSDGTISSVPRPLWGIHSFGSAATGNLKVGLFTFRDQGKTRIHLHGKGVVQEAFLQLSESLASTCRTAGLAL